MPLLERSTYHPPFWLPGGHLQTIWSGLLRPPRRLPFDRRRIATPDGDFLDLDLLTGGSERIAIISHGLEGSSRRPYVTGMARAFHDAGWDVAAWNFRGCSGEPNRLLRSYHSGASDDLAFVVDHLLQVGAYRRLDLVGFSLGGNVTLKYLGEAGEEVDRHIAGAVVFSVPSDLAASSRALARPTNAPYMRRFLRSLRRKMLVKEPLMERPIDRDELARMRTFAEFDDRFTAPIHGFAGAEDYWKRCSSRQFIGRIRVPTLIVNALNDPFLEGGCYPREEAARSASVTLELPQAGGHVGFVEAGGGYWSERRAVEFLRSVDHG